MITEAALSESLRRTIGVQVDIVNEDAAKIVKDIEAMMDIDTARGVWLDWLGLRVGIRRLWIPNDGTERFGFDGVTRSKGFLQAQFHSTEPSGKYVGLADEIFRLFIKSRGILDIGNGTIHTFKRAVKVISNEAAVIDNRDMSITIYNDRQSLFEFEVLIRLKISKCLPLSPSDSKFQRPT